MKDLVTHVNELVALLLKIMLFCISAHIYILICTDWCVFPRITTCRVCNKTVWYWNSKLVEYEVHLNDTNQDVAQVGDRLYRVHFVGYIHKSCSRPIIKVNVRWIGNYLDFSLDELRPHEMRKVEPISSPQKKPEEKESRQSIAKLSE